MGVDRAHLFGITLVRYSEDDKEVFNASVVNC